MVRVPPQVRYQALAHAARQIGMWVMTITFCQRNAENFWLIKRSKIDMFPPKKKPRYEASKPIRRYRVAFFSELILVAIYSHAPIRKKLPVPSQKTEV